MVPEVAVNVLPCCGAVQNTGAGVRVAGPLVGWGASVGARVEFGPVFVGIGVAVALAVAGDTVGTGVLGLGIGVGAPVAGTNDGGATVGWPVMGADVGCAVRLRSPNRAKVTTVSWDSQDTVHD